LVDEPSGFGCVVIGVGFKDCQLQAAVDVKNIIGFARGSSGKRSAKAHARFLAKFM
jgi:hypothetical protein